MHTLINGSQKNKNSNSKNFLNFISDYLDEFSIYDLNKDSYNDIINSINNYDSIVLAFPLYVDSPNSETLKFLDYIYDNKINLTKKRLYIVINCGFREGEQNITALNVIKRWCAKLNIKYSGSILIGAGEIVGNKKYKLICRKALKDLHRFSVLVSENKTSQDIITTMDLLRNKIYCKLANNSWNKKGRKNNLTKKLISKD